MFPPVFSKSFPTEKPIGSPREILPRHTKFGKNPRASQGRAGAPFAQQTAGFRYLHCQTGPDTTVPRRQGIVVDCCREEQQMTTADHSDPSHASGLQLLSGVAEYLDEVQRRIGPLFRRAEARRRACRFLEGLLAPSSA